MDWKILAAVLLSSSPKWATRRNSPPCCSPRTNRSASGLYFPGASLAPVAASGIGVMVGSTLSDYVSEKHLHYIAGAGFVIIGVLTLWKA